MLNVLVASSVPKTAINSAPFAVDWIFTVYVIVVHHYWSKVKCHLLADDVKSFLFVGFSCLIC